MQHYKIQLQQDKNVSVNLFKGKKTVKKKEKCGNEDAMRETEI